MLIFRPMNHPGTCRDEDIDAGQRRLLDAMPTLQDGSLPVQLEDSSNKSVTAHAATMGSRCLTPTSLTRHRTEEAAGSPLAVRAGTVVPLPVPPAGSAEPSSASTSPPDVRASPVV